MWTTLFCLYRILTSSVIYYWTWVWQQGIALLLWQHELQTLCYKWVYLTDTFHESSFLDLVSVQADYTWGSIWLGIQDSEGCLCSHATRLQNWYINVPLFLQVQKLKIVVHIADSNPTWFIMWPIHLVGNANWTAWSAIWSEILHLISKSNERATLVKFEINRSMISDQNCTT